MSASTIVLRRAILDWKDECLLDAELTLGRAVVDLEAVIAGEVHKAAIWKLAAVPSHFCASVIDPLVATRLRSALQGLELRATEGLKSLRKDVPQFVAESASLKVKSDVFSNILDLGSAGVPVAGALIAALALPAASTSTVAILLGLFTFTSVSKSILLGGVTVAAIVGAFGVTRVLGLKARFARRLQGQVRQGLAASVLAKEPVGTQLSALASYCAAIEEIAAKTLQEIDDAASAVV